MVAVGRWHWVGVYAATRLVGCPVESTSDKIRHWLGPCWFCGALGIDWLGIDPGVATGACCRAIDVSGHYDVEMVFDL